ncbi:HNH endonuclease [Bradyrhizobium vignae]|uniref:HNH endonuclease n=1 Tax=Bradyrhizobium vignae TaxID=1549949 RepID=UPI00100B3B9C|nr:HNH endonuclease signature motif containing protein [Bradyrhizobium vignae]RXH04916.1 HNH endonuclease [Bradyrhizobium vignae]
MSADNQTSRTSRKSIAPHQRFGIWKAWNGQCFWCREPVAFQSCEIDHVIPLNAVGGGKAAAVRTHFGLSNTFDFDNYENWVPAHAPCNRSKGAIVIDPAPATSIYLKQIGSKIALAKATADRVLRDNRKGELLARLQVAINSGDISEAEIQELWAGLPTPVTKGGTLGFLIQEELWIAPGWKVVQANGNLVHVVSAAGRAGVTSTSNHPSWVCSRCGNKGPWNGVICLSCGNREEPD